MNKKDLISIFLNGNFEETKFFQELHAAYTAAHAKNQARHNEATERLRHLEEQYEDGLDGQKNDVNDIYISKRDSIEKKHARQKALYTKACSIRIEDGYLHLFVTKMVDENLSLEKRDKIEFIEMAEKKFRLLKARIKLPRKFANKNPREDPRFASWIINKIRCNCLTALILAAEWMENGEIEFV